MKHLTLIRHAKSDWDNSTLRDFDRPLSSRGQRDAPRIGATLARDCFTPGRFPPPDRLISSPALRALTTAQIVAREIGYPADQILEEPRIYEASPMTLLHLIRELDDSIHHAMFFGHNPGFGSLASTLDPAFRSDGGSEFPTCAVALMQLDIPAWRDAAEHCAAQTRFFYPKML